MSTRSGTCLLCQGFTESLSGRPFSTELLTSEKPLQPPTPRQMHAEPSEESESCRAPWARRRVRDEKCNSSANLEELGGGDLSWPLRTGTHTAAPDPGALRTSPRR